MITNFSSYIKENKSDLIEDIKNFLVEENGDDSWKEFVDHQTMGDCQSIVASIIRQFPQAKKVFGSIKLDEPCIDWDASYKASEYVENDEITHHWVEIDGEIYDFSKGTLNGYIDGIEYEMYDPEVMDDWRYKEIGYFLKEGWINPFRKKKIKTNTHVQSDPYGEEDWEEDTEIAELFNRFYKFRVSERTIRIYFKVKKDKYLFVQYKVEGEPYITTVQFESGFTKMGSTNFTYLPKKDISLLESVSKDEFNMILDDLRKTNIFIPKSNLELLKTRFIY